MGFALAHAEFRRIVAVVRASAHSMAAKDYRILRIIRRWYQHPIL